MWFQGETFVYAAPVAEDISLLTDTWMVVAPYVFLYILSKNKKTLLKLWCESPVKSLCVLHILSSYFLKVLIDNLRMKNMSALLSQNAVE